MLFNRYLANFVLIFLFGLAALILSMSAQAAESTQNREAAGKQPAKMKQRFANADQNKDGMLSRTEATALPKIAKHFDAIDTNHDDQLARQELQQYRAKKRESRAGKSNNPSPST